MYYRDSSVGIPPLAGGVGDGERIHGPIIS
jgi:hypothetical protein